MTTSTGSPAMDMALLQIDWTFSDSRAEAAHVASFLPIEQLLEFIGDCEKRLVQDRRLHDERKASGYPFAERLQFDAQDMMEQDRLLAGLRQCLADRKANERLVLN